MNEEVNKYIISFYVFVIQAMEKEVMCGAKVNVQVSYNGGTDVYSTDNFAVRNTEPL